MFHETKIVCPNQDAVRNRREHDFRGMDPGMMQGLKMANVSIDHFDPIGIQFTMYLRVKVDDNNVVFSPAIDGTCVVIPIEDLM